MAKARKTAAERRADREQERINTACRDVVIEDVIAKVDALEEAVKAIPTPWYPPQEFMRAYGDLLVLRHQAKGLQDVLRFTEVE